MLTKLIMAWKPPLRLANICLFVMSLNLQFSCQTSYVQATVSSSSTISDDDPTDEPHFTISQCRDCPTSVVDCKAMELDEFPTWEGDKIKKEFPYVDLKLDFNKISKVTQIRNSSEMRQINFNRNIIDDIEPFAFVNLPNLTTLVFSHNCLQKIHPDAFRSKVGSPLPMENLDLSYNRISLLPEKVFDDLTKLKHLSLVENKISQLPTSLNTLVSLKTLNLSRNEFSELPTTLQTMVARLHSLDLSRNSFKRVPEVLRDGKAIETLIFSENNRTSDFNNQSFLGLQKVRVLEINKMANLMVIYKGTFTPLNSLEYLYCNSNPKLHKIEESSFANSFGGHPHLKQVDFSNNSFSSMDVGVFENMSLCDIDLTGNPLRCVCDIISLIQKNIRIEKKCLFYPENGDGQSFLEMNITDIGAFCVLEESASNDLFWTTIGILICFLTICLTLVLVRQSCQNKSQTVEIIPTQLQITRQYTKEITGENFDGKVCTEYTKSP